MNRPAPQPAPEKPVESFEIDRDPLTGWPIDQPEYRKAIPVYDAVTGELREFLP